MLLLGAALGGSYTQLNNTYQGQIGDREGVLESGVNQGRGWKGHIQAET